MPCCCQRFCGALLFKCRFLLEKRRDIYKSMIDAFEEYRFMRHELRNPSFLCPELDSENICPACPKQGSGKMIVSMDAIFGLPRKKSAGESVRAPLHGHIFFHDQAMVDEYIESASKSKIKPNKGCSNFVAGSSIRSASRYKALDETAVFGCVCRHEYPMRFFNLKHGERLTYAVVMAQWLHQEYCTSEKSHLYLMYDVACILEKYLKSVDPQLLQNIHLAVPSFHSYGHNASCQMSFSPLRCTGIGLSDGECVERLWSYLRRFTHMTKEMRPSHRIDVLTHAIAHYAEKTVAKLGKLLAIRYNRAVRSLEVASDTLKTFTEVSESDIKKWIEEEKHVSNSQFQGSELHTWKDDYYLTLHTYYSLQSNLSCASIESASSVTVSNQLKRLNVHLKDIESLHGVSTRWTPNDTEYKEREGIYRAQLKSALLAAIHDSSVKRKFLLHMKAKYADGQKIAKRLCTQISKETLKLKKLVTEYNIIHTSPDTELSIEMAVDPQTLCSNTALPLRQKYDIIQAYLRKQRSEEEMELLKIEMKQTLESLQQKADRLASTCAKLVHCEDQFSRGAHSVLITVYSQTQDTIAKARRAFNTACTWDINESGDETDSSDSDVSEDDNIIIP